MIFRLSLPIVTEACSRNQALTFLSTVFSSGLNLDHGIGGEAILNTYSNFMHRVEGKALSKDRGAPLASRLSALTF